MPRIIIKGKNRRTPYFALILQWLSVFSISSSRCYAFVIELFSGHTYDIMKRQLLPTDIILSVLFSQANNLSVNSQ